MLASSSQGEKTFSEASVTSQKRHFQERVTGTKEFSSQETNRKLKTSKRQEKTLVLVKKEYKDIVRTMEDFDKEYESTPYVQEDISSEERHDKSLLGTK